MDFWVIASRAFPEKIVVFDGQQIFLDLTGARRSCNQINKRDNGKYWSVYRVSGEMVKEIEDDNDI